MPAKPSAFGGLNRLPTEAAGYGAQQLLTEAAVDHQRALMPRRLISSPANGWPGSSGSSRGLCEDVRRESGAGKLEE